MSRSLSHGFAALLAVAFLAISFSFHTAPADAQVGRSGLPLPRFETIGSSEVRMRQGPSTSHRVLWEFHNQRGLPVEVVAETENWRQVRDPDGDLGWIHQSLLSTSRGVVIAGGMRPLRRRPASDAQVVAYLEARVVARLEECSAEWCKISVQGYDGWVRHDEVWGVYPGEVVN